MRRYTGALTVCVVLFVQLMLEVYSWQKTAPFTSLAECQCELELL